MSIRSPAQSNVFFAPFQYNQRVNEPFKPVSVYDSNFLPKYPKRPVYERTERLHAQFGTGPPENPMGPTWDPSRRGPPVDPLGPVQSPTVTHFGTAPAGGLSVGVSEEPLRTEAPFEPSRTGFGYQPPAPPPIPKRDESLPELSAHNSYHHTKNLETTRSVPCLRSWAGAWQAPLDNPLKDNLWQVPPMRMDVHQTAMWAGRPTDLREPWGERDGVEWNRKGVGVNLPLRLGVPVRCNYMRSSAPFETGDGSIAWRDMKAIDCLPVGRVPSAPAIASRIGKK